jgi:hypothetical protein
MLGVFYFSIYLFYMKNTIRLSESDLIKIVNRVIKEEGMSPTTGGKGGMSPNSGINKSTQNTGKGGMSPNPGISKSTQNTGKGGVSPNNADNTPVCSSGASGTLQKRGGVFVLASVKMGGQTLPYCRIQ